MSQGIEIERRLAAVLAADVAGFSRLTEVDEVGTMRKLAAQRAILDGAIARHRGRIANTAGDSLLAEFPSAVNAVQCAVEAQQALRDAAEETAEERRLLFRIGIHVGDVMVRGGDLLGSGVKVAARLEALADAGGIVLSAAAHEQVKKVLPLPYTDLGAQTVKNIEEPVRAFAIGAAATASLAPASGGRPLPLPDKPLLSQQQVFRWFEDRAALVSEGTRYSRALIELGKADADALAAAATFLGNAGRDPETARTLADQAIRLNANSFAAWYASGSASTWLGEHERALSDFARARRLSPADPSTFGLDAAEASSLVMLGRFEEALALFRRSLVRLLNNIIPRRMSIVALVGLGELEEAREAARQVLAIEPSVTISGLLDIIPYRHTRDRQFYAQCMRNAGMPE